MPEIFNITTADGRQKLSDLIFRLPDYGMIEVDASLAFGETYIAEDGTLIMSIDVSEVFNKFRELRLKNAQED